MTRVLSFVPPPAETSTPRKGTSTAFLVALATAAVCVAVAPAAGADYHVGPDQPLANVNDVPWESIAAGDVVFIHYRPQPYREKFIVAAVGTAEQPITVRGVLGPNGERPVLDGDNATTRLALNYWNEERSVIKIGGSSVPSQVYPSNIVIENLDIRGARPPNTFVDDGGTTRTYADNAAAIHVEYGEHLTIRNCELRDCGNGLFIGSGDSNISQHVLVEGNYIHDNGNVGSIYQHNSYCAALDIVYQFNRYGPLQSGAGGNNLKDRSAGQVVRYNWIKGGNRQLDLVEAEDSVQLRDHPSYHTTHVYGNVLIETPNSGNRQILHYGGDGGNTVNYRKGTLHFYHNTLVSLRTDRTTLMRLSTNDEHCDARNNILYVILGGDTLSMVDADGVLDLSHNWAKPGWRDTFGTLTGTINDDGTWVYGSDPGFVDEAGQEYALAFDSACVDEAASPHPDVLPDHLVVWQYRKHQGSLPRLTYNAMADLGAYEFRLAFDADEDGLVDLADLPSAYDCMAGPGLSPDPAPPLTTEACLAIFDENHDGDVDLGDLAGMQAAWDD